MLLLTWPAVSKSAARSGHGRPAAGSGGPGWASRAETATQMAMDWIRSPPAPLTTVVRSAHRAPVDEQYVRNEIRSRCAGYPRMARATRRSSQKYEPSQPASLTSSSAACWRYRASASSLSRPAGITSVLRTWRVVLNTRPRGGSGRNAGAGRCSWEVIPGIVADAGGPAGRGPPAAYRVVTREHPGDRDGLPSRMDDETLGGATMTQQGSADIGVTGLAVMGRNLARNLARHGY